MIPVEEAIALILRDIEVRGTEKIDILSSLGRVISENVYSGRDIPPFDNSAMDGYAVRFKDIVGASNESPSVLRVIEDVAAGYTAGKEVRAGEAVRIMTGAPIPRGADTVVMVEDTKKDGDRVRILRKTDQGGNIRLEGEDVRGGDLVVSKGTLVRPAEIGMMASVGRAFVHVFQAPRVAIISTGDELMDVDDEFTDGKIISTNSYTLASQVRECGGNPVYLGIARDTEEEIAA